MWRGELLEAVFAFLCAAFQISDLGQIEVAGLFQCMDFLCGPICEFRYPLLNIGTILVEPSLLSPGVKYPEVGLCVTPSGSTPLPIAIVQGRIKVYE